MQDINSTILQLPPALNSTADGRFINIFQIAPHRDAVSRAGDPDTERLDQTPEVERCCLSLHGKIGGDNHLLNLPAAQPLQQVDNMELIGADTIQWRKRTM